MLQRTSPGPDLQRQPRIRAQKTKDHLSARKMNQNPRDPTTKPQTEAQTMTVTNTITESPITFPPPAVD